MRKVSYLAVRSSMLNSKSENCPGLKAFIYKLDMLLFLLRVRNQHSLLPYYSDLSDAFSQSQILHICSHRNFTYLKKHLPFYKLHQQWLFWASFQLQSKYENTGEGSVSEDRHKQTAVLYKSSPASLGQLCYLQNWAAICGERNELSW